VCAFVRPHRQLTGHKVLQESNPLLLESINLRRGFVDPINLIQVNPIFSSSSSLPALSNACVACAVCVVS
jgi:phosphoenolpyruvate carboxylase